MVKLSEKTIKNGFKQYLKDLKRRKNIKNYYLKRIKGGKSYNAVLVDSLLIKILMSLLFFIFLIFKTKHFIISIIGALSFFSLALYASYYIKSNRYDKKVRDVNKDIVKKKIIKEINYFTSDEFIQYVKEILENYYDASFEKCGKDIDLIGKKEDEIWAVKCFKIPLEERISKKDIKDFKDKVDEIGIERGIVVTNSYFIEELEDEYEGVMEFVDFDKLIFMIKEIGEYPSKEEIEDIIINRYNENKRKVSEKKGKIFSKTKVIKYLFLSFSLYILSKMTIYRSYYIVMAFISLSLAIVSIFYEYFYKIVMKDIEE
ncbi:hypothetical protein FYJ27_05870 [Anaerosalibacter bizertensis]|uniref:Restriction endonuclease type IV Mrr domain-containing protein n=1 Tax=Anaerosalibacter bizertensis TaxID=932217 RepID=A0A844FGZ0_9FIRM|nr:restriction endonuclease [Anaerosalibacter bizertensis]MSS43259.1 hypothetical protein [Anaerosalibacter bizertensis]